MYVRFQGRTYTTIADLGMWGLNIATVICDLRELGQHVIRRYSDVIEPRKAIVGRRPPAEGLGADVTNSDPRERAVVL